MPHHDEIALDDDPGEDQLPGRHALYDANEFRKQFYLRNAAAIRHFRQLYHRSGRGDRGGLSWADARSWERAAKR